MKADEVREVGGVRSTVAAGRGLAPSSLTSPAFAGTVGGALTASQTPNSRRPVIAATVRMAIPVRQEVVALGGVDGLLSSKDRKERFQPARILAS